MDIINGLYEYRISGGEPFDISAKLCNTDGIDYLTVTMHCDTPTVPKAMRIDFSHPAINIQHTWRTSNNFSKCTPVTWMMSREVVSKACSEAPVICCYDGAGESNLCFSLDDALNVIYLEAGMNEETCDFNCACRFFCTPTAPFTDYEVTLRVDNIKKPYYDALSDVSRWWESMDKYAPAPVPEHATLPMYSTWYSYHQALTSAEIEAECKLAKEIGCETIIVDDGWMAPEHSSYYYCGDWMPREDKFPDIAAHIKAVHNIGLKYMLWFSVPFLGTKSKAYEKFKNKTLNGVPSCEGAVVFDPRYPEVREYLANIYLRAVREWGLDGFKLDFVDSFIQPAVEGENDDEGRDRLCVNSAAYALLDDVAKKLNAEKADLLFEFRQKYIGPVMRKFGNMMRAADCAYDSIQNRVRIVDIRLLCGKTACHSDMLTWNYNCPVSEAARQITNIIFSVPQISVRLAEIPQSHTEMLKFYLGFFKQYKNTLLFGKFEPLYPSANYAAIIGYDDEKFVGAVYDNVVLPLDNMTTDNAIINSGFTDSIVVSADNGLGEFNAECYTPDGKLVWNGKLCIDTGVCKLSIPQCGILFLKK